MSATMTSSSSAPSSGIPRPTHRSSHSESSSPLPFFSKRTSSNLTVPSGRIVAKDRHDGSSSQASSDGHGDQLAGPGYDVSLRSPSQRRKPVPGLLPMPNMSLPPSHPFASPISGSNTPYSAGTRTDEELFFVPPASTPRSLGPVPPRRHRSESPASVLGDERLSRESSLNAREEALRAREEALRQREEILRREEAIRQREDELKAREEALLARETASPVDNSRPTSYVQPYQPAFNASRLHRALPPVPNPSRPNLGSTDSSTSLVTPATSPTPPTPKEETCAPPRTLNIKPRPAPPPRKSTFHPNEARKYVAEFSVDGLPAKESITDAGALFLRDEDGNLVCFGDLFPHPNSPSSAPHPGDNPPGSEGDSLPPITKTVVFFIRHFWCGQCQDYTFASLSLLDPLAIRRAGVRVVVISNGSWKIIKSYKRILKCPFPIYVDGPRKLYQLLGMTKKSNDFGPMFKGRANYHQRAVPGQLLHGLSNAFFKFPLADPGKLTQLGGEFIFTSADVCDFAHRMTNTSDHMEAPEVLRRAGVLAPTRTESQNIALEQSQREELDRLQQETSQWKKEREAELDRIRRAKAERRGLIYDPAMNASGLHLLNFDEDDNEIGLSHDDADVPPEEAYTVVGKTEAGFEAVGQDVEQRFQQALKLEQGQEMEQAAQGTGNLDVQVEK